MTRIAAERCYKQAGISPSDLSVIELHDCCSSSLLPFAALAERTLTFSRRRSRSVAANELLVYDALNLTPPGKAHSLVASNDNTYGGKYVINPSGGLESKGHPLGATGLGMAFYCAMQLRGWAGAMQDPNCVPGAKEKEGKEAYALAHNLGLGELSLRGSRGSLTIVFATGGSCVVTIFKRPSFYKPGGPDGRTRLGYNHGAEVRGVFFRFALFALSVADGGFPVFVVVSASL